MATKEAVINVPEQMAAFLNSGSRKDELIRNAMIMFPFVRAGKISHGRAAEILDIKKWDLIELYDSLGLPYLYDVDEYNKDLETIDSILENAG